MTDLRDRTADRPSHLCAAYGCPMLGSMSGVIGGTEWWCWLHFGRDLGRMQAITSEIRRNAWLADAITALRIALDDGRDSPEWAKSFQKFGHECATENRNDLLWLEGESETQWLLRLETAFGVIVAAAVPHHRQKFDLTASLTLQPNVPDGKVSFNQS